jgi:hypothetical protein
LELGVLEYSNTPALLSAKPKEIVVMRDIAKMKAHSENSKTELQQTVWVRSAAPFARPRRAAGQLGAIICGLIILAFFAAPAAASQLEQLSAGQKAELKKIFKRQLTSAKVPSAKMSVFAAMPERSR